MKRKKDFTTITLAIIALLNILRAHGHFSPLDVIIIILLLIDFVLILKERGDKH